MTAEPSRKVWFHRDYRRFTGGHLKHAHYFDHVRQMPGFEPVLALSRWPAEPTLRREVEALWGGSGEFVRRWAPGVDDVLFLGGEDWPYLAASGLAGLPNPRINLIQGVRHANAGTELRANLARRAVRICVSGEVADAVLATGMVNGPLVTIPNGVDIAPDAPTRASRGRGIVIVGYKQPALARALSVALAERGVPHETLVDFVDRARFLATLRAACIAVCLPFEQEGFYLPALEAMACGCVVVTMDCTGNRSFCRPGYNCLIGTDVGSLASAVTQAARMSTVTRNELRARGRHTAAAHPLHLERSRFHAVLGHIDSLRQLDGPQPLPSPGRSRRCQRRAVDFMIVGAQKAGTTALAHFLSQHPDIGMSQPKEPHLFDAPGYGVGTAIADIDARYVPHFRHVPDVALRGEATPSYVYLPEVARGLRDYNPALKLIVLVRDPVERALSHYYMQRARGREHKPLWLALVLEPWRLSRDADPRRFGSATREHGYRRRGLYSRQLRNLYRFFSRKQVLIVRQDDMIGRHDDTLGQVLSFLGVSTAVRIAQETVFPNTSEKRPHRVWRALLRLSYVLELRRLRRMGIVL